MKFVIQDSNNQRKFRTRRGTYTNQLEKAWEFEDEKSACRELLAHGEVVVSLESLYSKNRGTQS